MKNRDKTLACGWVWVVNSNKWVAVGKAKTVLPITKTKKPLSKMRGSTDVNTRLL